MARATRFAVAALAAGLVHAGVLGAQPTVGQADTFEDGTTQGWHAAGGMPGVTHPSPPTNVTTGGPGGADDNYLLATSHGRTGPGSRLSFFNMSQWAGDYTAAGIGGIRFDAANFGQTDVYLRLALVEFGAMGPANAVVSPAVFLPGGAGWQTYFISIHPADLTLLLGSVESALANTDEVRFFHNPAPVFAGPDNSSPPIAASIGFDNITAVAVVPEPGTVLLLASGLLLLVPLARRRSRS
jgi:hypothetical protein